MVGTSFADAAEQPFPEAAASAPFIGNWQPAEPLSGLLGSGSSVEQAGYGGSKGGWTLRLIDLGENKAE